MALLLSLLVAAAMLIPPGAGAEPGTLLATLPARTRHLAVHEGSGLVVAAHGLEGVSFLSLEPGADQIRRAQWPTLTSAPIDGRHVLLGDRHSKIRLVAVEGTDAHQLAEWDVEGIPTHLLTVGDHLYVAAGGVGFQAFEVSLDPPRLHLIARHPFTDYTKELALGPENTVFLADNHDTGIQVLNMTVPRRPTFVAMKTLGFVDSIAYGDGFLVAGDRRAGAVVFDTFTSTPLEPIKTVPPSRTHGANRVASVRMSSDGCLLLIESHTPPRVCQLTRGATGASLGEPVLLHEAVATEGQFLADGSVLMATQANELWRVPVSVNPGATDR